MFSLSTSQTCRSQLVHQMPSLFFTFMHLFPLSNSFPASHSLISSSVLISVHFFCYQCCFYKLSWFSHPDPVCLFISCLLCPPGYLLWTASRCYLCFLLFCIKFSSHFTCLAWVSAFWSSTCLSCPHPWHFSVCCCLLFTQIWSLIHISCCTITFILLFYSILSFFLSF